MSPAAASQEDQTLSMPSDTTTRVGANTQFDYGDSRRLLRPGDAREGNPIRRLWHVSKFERVLDHLPQPSDPHAESSILDIGCFAGTFLSLVPQDRFSRQLGVDILPAQIDYANPHGTPFRSFRHVPSITHLRDIEGHFDCVTLIEVIEHLTAAEIHALFSELARLIRPGGKLVLTTPNYLSCWPLLEVILNRMSEVSYEEQHITRFYLLQHGATALRAVSIVCGRVCAGSEDDDAPCDPISRWAFV